METFGARLSRLRKERKLKRYDVAEPLGVDAETVARYERDEREPKVSDAVKIANILGVSIEYLVTGVISPQMSSSFSLGADDKIAVPVLMSGDSCNPVPTPEIVSQCTEYIIVPLSLVGNVRPEFRPFAVAVRDGAFERFNIRAGSYVVVNPAEQVSDFDISLVYYKGKLALKRTQHAKNGAVYLSSGAGGADIFVPPEDAADGGVFQIIGKAVAYQFNETQKIYHNI